MIKQYRKKPVVIEAVQWNGKNFREIADFMDCRHHDFEFEDQASRLYIQTLEGTMEAKTGDYIIKGVKGEFYPCKPEVFEATYEDTSKESDTDDRKTEMIDDDFQKNFERINVPNDPQIQSNVDEEKKPVSGWVFELRRAALSFLNPDVSDFFDKTADEIERLEKENTELRQKAENNNACYISEAAWAERVGKYLIDFDRNGYSVSSRCMTIYIPEEKYITLLKEYKALGHSLEG